MRYFKSFKNKFELQKQYRNLARKYHPDLGGSTQIMQKINYEYHQINKNIGVFPKSLKDIKAGNYVYVNQSKCIITEVTNNYFTVQSLSSNKVAAFDKDTGLGIFNFKIKARVN